MNLKGKVEFVLRVLKKDFPYNVPWADEDLLEVIVKKYRKKRTNKMNAYMWVELVPKFMYALRERGYRMDPLKTEKWIKDMLMNMTPMGTHEYLKGRFANQVEVDEETGEVTEKEPSTKDMTVDEMQEYWAEAIQAGAEEFGIQIRLPREMDFEQLIENDNLQNQRSPRK